jgi:uncharacterized protein
MSLGWSRRAPVETLVGTETEIEFAIPLGNLPRVSQELRSTEGEARGQVRFSRQLGHAVADLAVKAQPEVVCQRCMLPMRWPVEMQSRIALVSDYSAADRVPEGLEVFLVEGDSVSVRDLVDEEIMIALPHVPRHEEGSECAGRSMELSGQEPEAPEEAAAAQVQRPFAQLGELLKRK